MQRPGLKVSFLPLFFALHLATRNLHLFLYVRPFEPQTGGPFFVHLRAHGGFGPVSWEGEERNSFNDANEKENVYKAYSLIVMIVCKWYDITRGQINTINHLVQGINNEIKGKLNKFVQTTMQLFNAIFFFWYFFFFYWCYFYPWNSTIDFHLIYLILQ